LAKDKDPLDTTPEILLHTLLKNPTGPPTIAATALIILGAPIALHGLKWFFSSLTETLAEIQKAIDDAVRAGIEKLEDTADAIIAPVVDTVDATQECYDKAKIAGIFVPGVSSARFTACMALKGFSSKQSSTLLDLG